MSPQRLEEFRQMVREGVPVDVRGGHVRLADGPPPERGKRAAEAPPAGVRMKPHDWGIGAPGMALAPERGQKEAALLRREYPGFSLGVAADGLTFAHGVIGPSESLRGAYHVLVELPPGYGRGVLPRAYLLEPEVRLGAPHLFEDGALCLDHSGAFTARSTLITFLAWVSVWLVLYEGWLETGRRW